MASTLATRAAAVVAPLGFRRPIAPQTSACAKALSIAGRVSRRQQQQHQHRRPPRAAAADGPTSSSDGNNNNGDVRPPPPQSKSAIKDKLAQFGLGAFAAYGILSNLNAGILICISWLGVVHQLGVTPLASSNAAALFATSYAALYLTSNFLRPVRLSLALGAAPFFNRFLDAVERRLKLPRPAAFGVLLLMIATGTITTITAALAALGGFPNGVPSPEGLGELLKQGVRAGKERVAAAAGGG